MNVNPWKRTAVWRVPSEGWCEISLLSLLTKRFTYHTHEHWREKILRGIVRVNDGIVAPEHHLQSGDVVSYVPEMCDEPPVDLSYSIVFEDDVFLVVNKSGNLPCHPAGRYFTHTLWAELRKTGREQLDFVHRLDRETSGLVVIAKNSVAAKKLSYQFSHHQVEKTYSVWVHGCFPPSIDTSGWMTRDASSPIRKKRKFRQGTREFPPEEKAEWSETRFERIRFSNGLSQVRAYPKTGRTHQIRATLCSLGFPVYGDKLYGLDETIFLRFSEGIMTKCDRDLLQISHQALHAERIVLRHPETGEKMTFSAPPPEFISINGSDSVKP